jgi:hypothetical protein
MNLRPALATWPDIFGFDRPHRTRRLKKLTARLPGTKQHNHIRPNSLEPEEARLNDHRFRVEGWKL